ncbi:DUF47 domain-containing protein [Amycolatopsis magusensis]|uniref:Phosphate transport protein (TIGR00153 family) n=1 Tax=Amycolatopsis magusensis TaxID=882444 RepID=A0ABS4PYY0_9PSEU|nr:DUF47 family protein [Amycolatopsis magusensis]MBP2184636.1 putative phosphate transport protein (TIGR00153 family) [Amycolatopsis magusensis]MDI5981762.1 DUF47 family protein [Amycolatopsis magusensis]
MRLRLRPKQPELFEFYIRAARNTARAAEAMADLGTPGLSAEALSTRLVDIEHENDELTHELYNKLNSSFITPFDRDDMYRLGARLDDVIDHLEGAATLAHLYCAFDDQRPPPEMCEQLEVLRELGDLAARAFEDFAAKGDLKYYWVGSNELENRADRIYRHLLVRLFSGEYDALTVLKLKEIGDALEEAADAFEQVANTVEAITVKES